MSVLETAMIFQGETLLEKHFYSDKEQDIIKNRTNLIQAITNMAETAFDDEIRNFSVGDHEIILMSQKLESIEDVNSKVPIYMYAIAEKNINKKAVQESMETALFQFTNRYSKIDIFNKSKTKFSDFIGRLDKLFHGLIYKSDAEIQALAEKTEKKLNKLKIEEQKANIRNSSQRFSGLGY